MFQPSLQPGSIFDRKNLSGWNPAPHKLSPAFQFLDGDLTEAQCAPGGLGLGIFVAVVVN